MVDCLALAPERLESGHPIVSGCRFAWSLAKQLILLKSHSPSQHKNYLPLLTNR